MLVLSKDQLITNREGFEEIGIKTPKFDMEDIWEATKKEPIWLHFGGGNLFRAFHSVLQQRLLEQKTADKGIIVASTLDDALIEKIYQPHDNLSLDVVMKADGSLDMEVIASVAESIATYKGESSWERLKEVARHPSLQLISLSITEKGYDLKDINGEIRKSTLSEIEQGFEQPSRHTMILLASLLYDRYLNGKAPLALVSTDNFSHNGDKLKEAILIVAQIWRENDVVEQGFIDYLNDTTKITFPWSMIDKITPLPSRSVQEKLTNIGFGSTELIQKRENGSIVAPFVNTEESEYLVIEDNFPNGRPPLEEAGVYFTEKDVVDLVERMKVCTCLNPLHTALAIFGCLLDYTSIADEMKDEDLQALVKRIGYDEGLKVVTNPGIIDPMEFIKEVIEVRFPNPNNPDTPGRIATDTSQKLGIRFGETIKSYIQRNDLHITDLTFIPLTIAAWCRYLLGVNDAGKKMNISPDPILEDLQQYLQGIEFGQPESVSNQLQPILSNKRIFGVDLYEVGLGNTIEEFFKQLIGRPGAVRETLHEQIQKHESKVAY